MAHRPAPKIGSNHTCSQGRTSGSRRWARRAGVLAVGAAVSIGLAACSPTPSTLAHGPHGISQANRDAAAVITIYNTGFQPTISHIQAGLNVLVINDSGISHSLTAFDGAFDTGVLAAGGDDASFVVSKPGTYRYYDQVNPNFQGEIVVTPAPAG